MVQIGFDCRHPTAGEHASPIGEWVANAAGIFLTGVSPESIGVGGRSTIGRTVTVRLGLADHYWEAPVTFCGPWPWDFQLLGLIGFFRWFRACFHAADNELEAMALSD